VTAVTDSLKVKIKLCAASRCVHYSVTEVIELTVEYTANGANWSQGETRVKSG